MTDLTTRYLGLTLKNPIIAASSGHTGTVHYVKELEENGVGAVVLKSIFEEEILNEFNKHMNADDEFQSNIEFLDYLDYELKEDSVNKYVDLIKEVKKSVSVPVIASVNCVSAHEWTDFAKKLEEAGADALELNIFLMPSDTKKTGQEIEETYFTIIKKVLNTVKIPVAVKMSQYFSNLGNMIQRLSETGISGLVLFNRSFSPDIDLSKMEIVSSNVFSRPEDYTLPLRWVAMASDHAKCSLAASTGIHDAKAMIKLLIAGASAVQVASTIYINGPKQINKMLTELEDWMSKNNYLNINQFKGKLSQKNINNPAEFERVQFMKYFSDREVN
ncbi:MAG: dihydroorotate dehydrogenase-like protein [Chlorobi bacterium]|nr:dihydroorotate dehydrogenase-like protein [Chlorobiota bacterium]